MEWNGAAHSSRLHRRIKDLFWKNKAPLVVTNLPMYSDIEDSKILLLILGETIGKCVAYSEYNQTYITDISPTSYSTELSSGREILDMHNDLTFATDKCRPAALVLTPHIANHDSPKTLLAPAQALLNILPDEVCRILEQEIFEIRCGGKLRWPYEQVRRLSVIAHDPDGLPRVRMSFNSITPISSLDQSSADDARRALEMLAQEALRLGREGGHQLRKGEALLIPNDYCLHGRESFQSSETTRLLLRSYVVTEDTVREQYGNTMLSLRF